MKRNRRILEPVPISVSVLCQHKVRLLHSCFSHSSKIMSSPPSVSWEHCRSMILLICGIASGIVISDVYEVDEV